MAETFKAGDVVELKSGSPQMTISDTSDDGIAWCIWYDFKTNEWREDVKFPFIVLKRSS